MDTDSFLFQKSRIECAWQQVGDMKLFALAVEVREHDRRASREFPDDLAAGATGRRQRFRVGNYSKFSKLPFTFRKRLPNRNAFRANSQSITRALDVAASVDLATRSSHRRAHLEI